MRVSVLSNAALTGSAVGTDRLFAGLLIAGFVILAFGFAFIASRALQSQVSGFLQAARRLGGGDFSSPVPTHGNDELAAVGAEFNNMSAQLQAWLTDLEATVQDSEGTALEHDGIGWAHGEGLNAASVALGAMRPAVRPRRDHCPSGPHLRTPRTMSRSCGSSPCVHRWRWTTRSGHFQELLSADMEEVRRFTYPVGLVMMDIDNFKSVNDGYGHQQGDRVLRRVSSILRETKRDVDVAARVRR